MSVDDPTATECEYIRPDSIEEARAALARSDPSTVTKVVAGGQSLSLLVRQDLIEPDRLVDVGSLPSLRGVEETEDGIRIGAATTYADLEAATLFDQPAFAGFSDALSVIADRQVKNMGTIGGAIAHADPALDLPAMLICFDADVRIGHMDGARTVPFESFVEGYMMTDLAEDELVESITLDVPMATTASAYEKLAPVAGGWATVGAGSRITIDDGQLSAVRIALVSVGDTTVRARRVEEELVGTSLETAPDVINDVTALVVDEIDPMDDIAGSASYKESLAKTLAKRSLNRALSRTGGDY